jgi:diadenosine tetraphosphate (Ap4A) HIT family hydrolase
MLTLSQLRSTIKEKDEHKRSPAYRKLAPKLKKAVDDLFNMMAKSPQKVLTTFPKVVRDVSKKYRVQPKDIETYFTKETGLTI